MKPESITIDMTGDLFRPITINGGKYFPAKFTIEDKKQDNDFEILIGRSLWHNPGREETLELYTEIKTDNHGEIVDYYVPDEKLEDRECSFTDEDKRYSQNFWSCATQGVLPNGLKPVGFYGLRVKRLTKTRFEVYGKVVCWNPDTDEYSIRDGKVSLDIFLEPFKFTASNVWLNHWSAVELEVL